jgi:hypothetical protein
MNKKECHTCKQEIELDKFPLWKLSKDGYASECKDCHNKRHKEYCSKQEVKKQRSVYFLNYRKTHREKYLANKAKNQRRRNAERRPLDLLHNAISSKVLRQLKTGKYGKRTFEIIGYTPEELKQHLEKQFLDGMSWENYGQWHIDHKIPKSAFNITSYDDIDFKRCWALSNLQPLWAIDNYNKRDKLNKPFQPSLAIAV